MPTRELFNKRFLVLFTVPKAQPIPAALAAPAMMSDLYPMSSPKICGNGLSRGGK